MDRLPTAFGTTKDQHKQHSAKASRAQQQLLKQQQNFARFQRHEYKTYLARKQEAAEASNVSKQKAENKREAGSSSGSDSSEYSDSSDDDDDTFPESQIFENVPASHHFTFNANNDSRHEFNSTKNPKAVASIASNPRGDSFVVGLNSNVLKIYDFANMNPNADADDGRTHSNYNKPAASYETVQGSTINKVLYLPVSSSQAQSADNFLCVGTSPRFRLYLDNARAARHDDKYLEFKPGDIYLHDVRQTSGHVAEVNDCCFNFQSRSLEQFVTCSSDGSVRLWDTANYASGKIKNSLMTVVIANRHEAARSVRVNVRNVLYCNENRNTSLKNCIVTADDNNDLSIWDLGATESAASAALASSKAKAVSRITDAFADRSTIVTALQFAHLNSNTLMTRSNDGFLKLFDVRSFTQPVLQRQDDIFTSSGPGHGPSPADAKAEAIFNNNDKYILTGDNAGYLHVIDSSDLHTIMKIDINSGNANAGAKNITAVHQNFKINQLFLGTTTGQVSINFNSGNSFNGIISNLNTPVVSLRKRSGDDEFEITSAQDLFEYEKRQKLR